MRFKKSAFALACTTSILGLRLDAQAAEKTWIGGTGNWTVNSNWAPFGSPADFDKVRLHGNDATNRVVTYNVNDGFLHVYDDIAMRTHGAGSIELRQPGTDFETTWMSLTSSAGATGSARHVITGGATAYIGTSYVSDRGLLSVGVNCAYRPTTLWQTAGSILSDTSATFIVGGSFIFQGGSFAGPVRIANTGRFHVNAATFGGAVQNFGTLDIIADTNFTDRMTNYSSFAIPAGRTIVAERWDQRGGTSVTQSGNTRGGFFTVQDGATWNMTGGTHQGTQITAGSTAGNGTYVMSAGSVNMNAIATSRIVVGLENTGSFLQSGGEVRVPFLYVGGSGTLGSGSGFYRLSGGTLLCTGQMWVGTDGALGGTYTQTAGHADIARIIVNENATSSGSIQLSGGTLLINSTSTSNGTWSQSGGRARVDGFLDGSGTMSVTGSGSLTVARLRQQSLFVGGDARVINNDLSITNQLNRLNSLVFEEAAGGAIRGTWDLDNTLLAIDYTGTSPITNISRYISSGHGNGSWNGTGLRSALAAAFGWGLGYAEASNVLGPNGGSFGGEAVNGTTVIVRFTRYGDANLDGIVNLADFNRLAGNFGGSNKVWSQGDFNYDGIVNLADFNRLAANFGLSASGPDVTPEDWANLAAVVPEPGVLWFVPLAGGALRRGRRGAGR